jgi:type II secretory ATPase GspE/PulE/Tfp pilus assembly ATPase PilB-like protein
MGVPSFLVSSTLLASISQRLVRRLCQSCCVPETNELLLSRVPAELRMFPFRSHAGCGACRNVGYAGRLAVFEMLRMTHRVRTLVEINATPTQLLDAAKFEGFRTLYHNGVIRATELVTSLSEVSQFAQQFLHAETVGLREAA